MAQIGKTWLFVPAKEKYVERLAQIEADVIILDLEDSLAPEQKDEGLKLVETALREYGKGRAIYVRVNGNGRLAGELEALWGWGYELAGFMIPKFEDVSLLEMHQKYLQGKEVIALIESVKGIMKLSEIAAHPLVHALAFGGEDFRRELGFEAGEEATLFARNQVVMQAAYHQKESLDTVSMEIRDMDKFLEDYQKSMRMGFKGKLLIHPAQALAVKKYYRESNQEYLQRIVEAFDKSSEGIIKIDGKWYEKPHIEKIKKYLQELEGR
ncbi:MAG: CoA ester lyase [Clostridium sp.]|nr:CoA ester lyase [Clostridium sp.]